MKKKEVENMEKVNYEIRQIEAWNGPEGWTWNQSWKIGTMTTGAKNVRRAFTAWLRRKGITFKVNKTRIEYDGDVYEIQDRKTGEPLFAALPVSQ